MWNNANQLHTYHSHAVPPTGYILGDTPRATQNKPEYETATKLSSVRRREKNVPHKRSHQAIVLKCVISLSSTCKRIRALCRTRRNTTYVASFKPTTTYRYTTTTSAGSHDNITAALFHEKPRHKATTPPESGRARTTRLSY